MYNRHTYIICINCISVDCEWGDWVEGECSTTCGPGVQNNTRIKLIEEAFGGTCIGEYNNVTNCELEPCPGMYVSLKIIKKHFFIYIDYVQFKYASRLFLN